MPFVMRILERESTGKQVFSESLMSGAGGYPQVPKPGTRSLLILNKKRQLVSS
jgi:hypothetical protein